MSCSVCVNSFARRTAGDDKEAGESVADGEWARDGVPEGHPSIVLRSRLSATSQDDTDVPNSDNWRIVDKRSKEASKSARNDLKSLSNVVSAWCNGSSAISFLTLSTSEESLS